MSARDGIDACNSAFYQALREGDGEVCASLCAEDAVMMPPNAAPIEGREAIRQHFAKLGPDASVAADIVKIEASDRLAYQRTRVSWDANGRTKYTESIDVLRRQDDGSWLFVASAWNSSEGFEQ